MCFFVMITIPCHTSISMCHDAWADTYEGNGTVKRGGRNRIGRREKWPKKSWEEGEIGGKSREEGEKET